MKFTFVVSASRAFHFPLNCIINAAKHLGSTAEFNILYDDIPQELREIYTVSFPFKITWHNLQELYQTLPITATRHVPSKFWSTPWMLAAKLLDEYDSICILQADEMLLTNVDSIFRMVANSDVVVATEYHVGHEAEDLPFGTVQSILNREQYALYDQLVFCGKASKQILIDTYMQQCVEKWSDASNSEAQDPLCALNQAASTHLSKDRIFGLDCHTWTYDKGAWSRRKLRRDGLNLYDGDIRLHGMHTKWWLPGVIPTCLERETDPVTKDIIAHNYSLEREIMVAYNDMTPATRSEEYEKTPFKQENS